MDERQEVKSLKKALRALTFLNCHGESTVTEVACAIGVPRTTAHRLLETLAKEGYVEKQNHSNIYRLTSMVQKLSSGFGGSDLVVELAKPLINRVGGYILWPLALATPQGCDMMVRIATDHDTPVAIDRYLIGFRTPMLHAPAGLCYLAFCEDGVRESVLNLVRRNSSAEEQQRHPDADLDFTLEQTRRLGYCHIRFAQYREGGLAVPVFAENRVVGGIVMRYMKASMKGHQVEERYVPILQKLADDIAAAYDRRVNVADAEQAQDHGDLNPSADDVAAAPAPFWISGTSPIRQGAVHHGAVHQGRIADGLHRASR
jgi:IclR family mhp operon transcriptional activator